MILLTVIYDDCEIANVEDLHIADCVMQAKEDIENSFYKDAELSELVVIVNDDETTTYHDGHWLYKA